MLREKLIVLGKQLERISKFQPGYYDLKYKPWFEGWSKLLDQRKQAKFQWSRDKSKVNGDDLNTVRCEAGQAFQE
jgi:hypothetical protein